MMQAVNLLGRRFGRLTVLKRKGSRGGHALWRCACTCGAVVDVMSHHLLTGGTRSCGCLVKDINCRPELAPRNAVIRRCRQQGRSYHSIAVEFRLSLEHVRRICLGQGP